MDELDARISNLTQVLNSPIEDDFSELVGTRLNREGYLRYVLLVFATSVGLSVSITPITRLVVAISGRLLGAPAELLSLSRWHGVILSGVACLVLLILAAALSFWDRKRSSALL